jgi:hypothetical protein
MPDSPVVLEGSPFDLQHLVYRCLDAVLGACQAGQAVDIRLERDPDGARIELLTRDPCQPEDPASGRFDLLKALTRMLGGESTIKVQPGQSMEVAVRLPRGLESLVFEKE